MLTGIFLEHIGLLHVGICMYRSSRILYLEVEIGSWHDTHYFLVVVVVHSFHGWIGWQK